jgi:hypothetical protein
LLTIAANCAISSGVTSPWPSARPISSGNFEVSKPSFVAKGMSAFGPPTSSSRDAVAMFCDHVSPCARHAVDEYSPPTLRGLQSPCGVLKVRGSLISVLDAVYFGVPSGFFCEKASA